MAYPNLVPLHGPTDVCIVRDGWIHFGLSTVCYHLDPPLDQLLHCPPPHHSRRFGIEELLTQPSSPYQIVNDRLSREQDRKRPALNRPRCATPCCHLGLFSDYFGLQQPRTTLRPLSYSLVLHHSTLYYRPVNPCSLKNLF